MIQTMRILFLMMICLGTATISFAGEGTRFFSALEDIPLAPGIAEITDQTISFDKPEGRIIESVAVIQGTDEKKLMEFYDSTLPQLGWAQQKTPRTFARDGEILRLTFETGRGQKFLRIALTPVLDK